MNDIVLQKLDAGLLTITMNRPDRRNALNPDMTRVVEAARRAAGTMTSAPFWGGGGTFLWAAM
jgi:2-(1,2-epoxy-1,2-dihydrophenyl)acetyl-CoA isomerase